MATIPDPPLGGPDGGPPSATLDELFQSVQDFAKLNGFAVVKKRAGNKHNNVHTYCEFHCDRGESRPSEGAGIRNTSTRKIDCPWKMIASAGKRDNWHYVLRYPGTGPQAHNHAPSSTPAAHPAHRKWGEAEKALLSRISKHSAIQAREAGAIVRETFNTPFTNQDIHNARARLRADELDGYTPIQALVRRFEEESVSYVKRVNDKDEVVALFWTFNYCTDMWKRFPTVLSLDNTYNTNRFKMPLFNITGLTNLHTNFNVGFGLVDNERLEGFLWLVEAMDSIRQKHSIPTPQVCLTDFEPSLRDALMRVYPDTQLQICIFHINANVVLNVKKKWRTPPGADNKPDAVAFEREDEDQQQPGQAMSEEEQSDLQELNAPAHEEAANVESSASITSASQQIPHTKKGIFML